MHQPQGPALPCSCHRPSSVLSKGPFPLALHPHQCVKLSLCSDAGSPCSPALASDPPLPRVTFNAINLTQILGFQGSD
jgi:hypothetical protein